MKPRGWIRLVAATALVVSACGSANDGSDSPSANGEATAETVSFVSQNILHGIDCAPETNGCALAERVGLFLDQLEAANCPDLVGLQEANQEIADLISDRLADVCDGAYTLEYDGDTGIDRELVLTTGEVLGARRDRLAGPLRSVYTVRVATDAGVVNFVTTHLASGSDNRECDAELCPPPCSVDDTLNTCQARQIIALVDEIADPDAIVIVGGDLNATIDEPTNVALREAGYIDTHLAAGNAECDPTTGAECTSGRVDEDLSNLSDPTSTQDVRIDFLWVSPSRDCKVVAPTGLFNAEPAIDDPARLAFPADHTGVEATLRCDTTDAHRDAATTATLDTVATTTTTAARSSVPLDAATESEITTAFENLFGGDVTDIETKLGSLQDAELLRASFLQTYEETKTVAAGIRVRIDNIALTDPTHADVTYSLLLNGATVLDSVNGTAVREDGRWLVTRAAYCEISSQGSDEIPEPCRE